MRGVATLFVAVVVSLAGLFSAPVGASSSIAGPLSGARDTTSTAAYSLLTLPTCQIGDGITILKNSGKRSLVITSVKVITPSQTESSDRISYELESFKAGTTTGALGATFSIALKGGTVVGNAVGATINSFGKEPLWYVVVVFMKLSQSYTGPWAIRGLRISYRVGTKNYHVFFSQTIRLPRSSC
jgi:hypothetical protein